MYTGMPFRVQSGLAGGRGPPRHSQSLTVLGEVGFSGALPQEVPNRTFWRSDQEVRSFHRHGQALTLPKKYFEF